jgi:hypothetical protein
MWNDVDCGDYPTLLRRAKSRRSSLANRSLARSPTLRLERTSAPVVRKRGPSMRLTRKADNGSLPSAETLELTNRKPAVPRVDALDRNVQNARRTCKR